MNCPEYQIAVGRILDGEATSDTSVGVFSHLSACDACRGHLHQQITLSRHLGQITADPPRAIPVFHARTSALRREGWWDRRISLRASVATVLGAVLIAAAVWFDRSLNPQQEIVVITTLPTVNVSAPSPVL